VLADAAGGDAESVCQLLGGRLSPPLQGHEHLSLGRGQAAQRGRDIVQHASPGYRKSDGTPV
jgi:hypothetical protein